jgi:hypothetical protein
MGRVVTAVVCGCRHNGHLFSGAREQRVCSLFMGSPSDRDPERKAAPSPESIDDGWGTDSPAHNDRTTAGLYVDPATIGRPPASLQIDPDKVARATPAPGSARATASPDNDRTATGLDLDRLAASADPDRTAIAPYAEPPAPKATGNSTATALDQATGDATVIVLDQAGDSTVIALDQAIDELERPSDIVELAPASANDDRTKADLPVEPPRPSPALILLQPGKGVVPLDKERVLAQPERSPLDFVLRDMDPAAPAQTHSSGDSSKFVAALIGDQPPPRIEAEPVTISAIQPVLRRPRRGRLWIAAGALAATAALGTAFAMKLTGGTQTPRPAASDVAKVVGSPASADPAAPAPTAGGVATPSTAATPGTAATPTNVATDVTPTAPEAPGQVPAPEQTEPTVAEAETAPPATVELAAVAPETATPARAHSPAKPIAKKSVAVKETAKKPSTAKKPTPAKKPADKAVAKRTAAKSTAEKKTTSTKKTAAAKKPAPAKKPATTKKTATKKSSRS